MSNESRIVWLRDPSRLDFVRVKKVGGFGRRAGLPKRIESSLPGIVVGYAELLPDYKRKCYEWGFARRFFWLRDTDPYPSGCPAEAVNPLTIDVNVEGVADVVCTGRHFVFGEFLHGKGHWDTPEMMMLWGERGPEGWQFYTPGAKDKSQGVFPWEEANED